MTKGGYELIDQLTIKSTSSYDDFEASIKERMIGAPKKKIIKETVPFSNETHDFSGINGEIYWEERTLKYVFEIIANKENNIFIRDIIYYRGCCPFCFYG